MRVIGLTGGIGSGKSAVARFLREMGAVTIDADKVGHQLLESDTLLSRDLAINFGNEVLDINGKVDRRKLAKVVFRNPEAVARLNNLTHPRIYDVIKKCLENYRNQGTDMVVLEAPLMIEAGWTSLIDELWVVITSRDKVLRRLKERGLSEQEALSRIDHQMPPEEKVKQASRVIYNDGTISELKIKVGELWKNIHS